MRPLLPLLCVCGAFLGASAPATAQAIPATSEWDGTSITISWRTTPPLEFDLESTTTLFPGSWLPLPLASYSFVVDGDLTRVTHPGPAGPRRFYRGALQPGRPLCTDLCLVRTINLLEARGRDLDTNVLKLFRAVADPCTNRLFVSGSLTREMGVLDTSTQTWEGTISTTETGLQYLWADTTNRLLFNANADSGVVTVFNLDTSAEETSTTLEDMPGEGLAALFRRVGIDTSRGRIIVPDSGPPFLRAYHAPSLARDPRFVPAPTAPDIGIPIYDPLEDLVYAFDNRDTDASRNIYRLHSVNGSTLATIPFAADIGELVRFADRNFAAEQFIILTQEDGPAPANQTLMRLDGGGGLLASGVVDPTRIVTEMIVDPEGMWVALFSIEPPSGGRLEGTVGRLDIYDPASMLLVSSTPFGLKPTSIAFDAASGRIYAPNGDASIVWSFDPPYTNEVPIPLGDSLEQIVPVPGTGTVYMNSRLGGSYLWESNVLRYEDTPFVSGTWPIPLRVDPSGDRLYVLNAWDSTLAIYDLNPSRHLEALVPLGIAPGSTDRIPDMVVDATNHRAYAAYPEFQQIVTVDTAGLAAIGTRPIPDITPGTAPGGPGQVNLGVNEDLALLYAFVPETRNMVVYTPGLPMPLENDLRGEAWGATLDRFPTGLIFRDEIHDRLFVGPVELDPMDGSSIGNRVSIGNGDRIFAFDPLLDSYWTIGWEVPPGGGDPGYFVAVIDRATLALQEKRPIPALDQFSPSVALDVTNRLLHVGYLTKAQLHIYAAPRSLPFVP